jgi:hypothetical protein
MDIFTTRPVEEVDKKLFSSLFHLPLLVHAHALDYLSKGQRKVFKEKELLEMVERETPRKVFLQKNGCYAVFYRRPDGYRKLIIDIESTRTIIVSFMDTPEIPRYRV